MQTAVRRIIPGKFRLGWAIVNVIVLLIYLLISSRTWLPANERALDLPVSVGDGILWVFLCLPILIATLLANIAAIVVVATKTRGAGRKGAGIFVGCLSTLWIIAVIFDFQMRG